MRASRIVELFTGMMCMLATRGAIGAELSWQSAPGCPARDEVVFRIERALGAALDAAPPLHFHVALQRSRAGFRATLDVEGKSRALGAPDCSKLADAVAVAIALALGASEPVANDVARPEPALPPSPPPQDVVEPEPAPAPIASNAPVPNVSAWLLGDVGTLPSLAAGAALGAELGWSRFELRALALLLFEQHVDRSGQSGCRQMRARIWRCSPAACRRARRRWARFAAIMPCFCARGPSSGAFRAAALG